MEESGALTWEKGCEEMVIISSQPLLGYDENVSNSGEAAAAALGRSRSNFRTFHDLQHFFLHVQIPVCIVGAYLGFPKIVAVGTPADGDEGRRLDSFGYGKSCKKVPPALQVLNESGVGGKEVFYLYGAARCSSSVPSLYQARMSSGVFLCQGSTKLFSK